MKRGSNRVHHFGPTAAGEALDELPGRLAVLRGGWLRIRPEDRRLARECDHVEGVPVTHRVDRPRDHGLALLDRETAHGTRGVEDEDQFTSADLLRFNPGGRGDHHAQISARDNRGVELKFRAGGREDSRCDVGEHAFSNRVVLQPPT